jgi:tetratricopeptide (TPR) repeat protein
MISQEEFKILKNFAGRIPANDPGAHNNLAIVYYNKSLYDEAIEELEKAITIDPNFVIARNNLDIILKKIGRLDEKVNQLVRIIDREPYDEKKTLELADTYRKLNRYSRAIVFYRMVLDKNHDSFEGHYGLGITLKMLDKYGDALEEIKRALEIKVSPKVYQALGEVYFKKGVIDLAIHNFREAIALDPSSAEGHFLLGYALGEKGKEKESLEEINKAIAQNPTLAQFESNLPNHVTEYGERYELLKEQLAVPKISEDEYQTHYNLAMTYYKKGLFNEAKREFDECLRLNIDSQDVYVYLGEVSIFLNKFDDAIKYLHHVYEADFDSVRCINALGVAYCMEGNVSEAVKWFQNVFRLEKDYPPSLNNLAVCQFIQGNFEEAVNCYQQAIDAGNVDARFNLGMYYFKEGDYDNAFKLFSGDTADEYFGKGLVYAAKGKDDEALEFFKKILTIAPEHAGAYYNIGFMLTKFGEFKEGLNYIRKGIEIEPNYEKDKYRLSLSAELSGFGVYYIPTAGKKEQVDIFEKEIFKPEVADAAYYINQAEYYLKKPDLGNALDMVDQAYKIKPEWNKVVILKAKILYLSRNTYDAINLLTYYRKSHGQDKEVNAALAAILNEVGRLAEAKNVYLELLEMEKNNVEWLTELAEVLYNMNEQNEALSLYSKIYEINNENIAANLGFLKIHIKNKNLDKATPYLDFLKKNYPDFYDFNILAGAYYLEKNDPENADSYFNKAIELDSSKPLPYYQIGLLQVQQGNFDVACDNWKKALLLSPGEELVEKTRQCLRITVELNEFLKKEV